MHRAPLGLALVALIAAALPSPGLYLAVGAGIAAIGTGWVGFRAAELPGAARLIGATAVTLGGVGLLLGVVRMALVLAAISRLERMLGP